MNSFITSQIRTYVPIAIGAFLTYLARHYDIVIDEGSSAALVAGVQALVTAAYYFAARKLEKLFPQLGTFLLGSSAQPVYREVK